MSKEITRRNFLGKASLYGGGLALATRLPLAEAAAKLSAAPAVLTDIEWQTVNAMCGRIIPTDDSPGAIEANCVNFIDKALANEEQASMGPVKSGVSGLNKASMRTHGKVFTALVGAAQDAMLVGLESNSLANWPVAAGDSAEFFELIRALTIMGFLADPSYGGNQNYAGWKVAGYPGPRHHQGGYSDEQMVGAEPIRAIWDLE